MHMGPRTLEALHLALAILKFVVILEQTALRFSFTLGPANDVTSPAVWGYLPTPVKV
jgi:hypothetical protein